MLGKYSATELLISFSLHIINMQMGMSAFVLELCEECSYFHITSHTKITREESGHRYVRAGNRQRAPGRRKPEQNVPRSLQRHQPQGHFISSF